MLNFVNLDEKLLIIFIIFKFCDVTATFWVIPAQRSISQNERADTNSYL